MDILIVFRQALTKVTNPQGSAKSSVFDYAANKITLTDENGNTVTYDYDCFGNLEEVKAGNSLLKKCEYDYKNFCLIKETSPDSKTVTSYTYDSASRPVSKITLENGKEIYNETMSYGMENVSQYTKNLPSGKNATGNVVTSVVKGDGTNTQSITTKTVTDYNGNTISQECGGVKKSYEYDCLGNMIKESPYAGYSITYEYDPAGNVVSQTDSTGVTSKKEYDGLGRLVKEYTPKGIAGNYFTQYTYKGFTDMLKSVTIPLDNGQNMVKEYETDKTGNVLKETVVGGNAGNSVTEYTYNEIGLPVTVTAQGNKEANVTTYTYDKVGNKTSMTTGNALSKTIYKYDNLNRLTYLITVPNETKYTPDAAIIVFPEHCIEKYEYDVNGNLSKKTDRNGNVITYAYDGLNRLKSQKTGDLEKTAEYALTGAKVKENYGNAELNYKYDARGNLTYEKSSIDNKSFINEYTYDSNNFLNSFKYKNDNTQVAENTYTYTAKGQLEKVYENGNQVAAYSYDLNGNLEKTTYGNNVETAYNYNYAGLVKSVQSKNGNTVLDSHSYTYYNDGNQKTKTDNGVITTYSYDLYGRLISETAGKEKKNYTYDMSGNRTRISVSGSENYNTYYNYDAYNRLTRETTNEKGKAERNDNNYYYDFNGNQTLITYDRIGDSSSDSEFKFAINNSLSDSEKSSRTFNYNGFNELINVRGQGNDDINYSYRPDGLMFKRSELDNIYYSWQGNNIIAEADGYGANKVYTRGLGLIKSKNGYYYLLNGHGDVSALTKENGTVSTRYAYDAFGNSSSTGESSNNPFGYCGEYYDSLSGYTYLRARIYNPGTGRFTTEDPLRDGLNWYAYCGNNPVMFVDPTGLLGENFVKNLFINENRSEIDSIYIKYLDYLVDKYGNNGKKYGYSLCNKKLNDLHNDSYKLVKENQAIRSMSNEALDACVYEGVPLLFQGDYQNATESCWLLAMFITEAFDNGISYLEQEDIQSRIYKVNPNNIRGSVNGDAKTFATYSQLKAALEKCGGPIYSELALIDSAGNSYNHESVVIGVTKDINGKELVIYNDLMEGTKRGITTRGLKMTTFNDFSKMNKGRYVIPKYRNH